MSNALQNIASALHLRRRRTRSDPGALRRVAARHAFKQELDAVVARHERQTLQDVADLRARYREPVWGKVDTWQLLTRLGECIDPSDRRLGCVSQLTHSLQVVDSMEAEGIDDPDLLAAGLLHDIGKLLLLTGEDPANVVCMIDLIGPHEPGIGLDASNLRWNHDEFGYTRLVGQVPDAVARLVRYHSIDLEACASVFNDADRAWVASSLRPFVHHDQDSKASFATPRSSLADLRDRLGDRVPATLDF